MPAVVRAVSIYVWVALTLAAACASSEEEGLFEEEGTGGTGPLEASVGSGGSSNGGTGGGAVDSSASGGSAGFDSGNGFGGAGGGGVGGSAGVGGTGGSGSCNPAFCPNNGSGAPCCMTPNGPCGSDMGLGCQANAGPDI
jgi:hypothetical protein